MLDYQTNQKLNNILSALILTDDVNAQVLTLQGEQRQQLKQNFSNTIAAMDNTDDDGQKTALIIRALQMRESNSCMFADTIREALIAKMVLILT